MLISGAETTSEWPLPVGLNPDLTRSEDEGLLEAIKHGTSLEGQEAFSVLYERHCLDVSGATYCGVRNSPMLKRKTCFLKYRAERFLEFKILFGKVLQ